MTSKPEDVDEEQDDLASGPQSTRLANDLRGVRRSAGWGSGDGEQTGGGPDLRVVVRRKEKRVWNMSLGVVAGWTKTSILTRVGGGV